MLFLTLNKKNLYHFPIHKKIDTGMHRLGFEEIPSMRLLRYKEMKVHVKKYLIASKR
jgi:alanine racemase